MQLYEFQAKQILKENGIPIPKGRLALTAETAVQVSRDIHPPVVVKAQVLTGGRGLAGGVRFCANSSDVNNAAVQVLGMDIKGEKTRALLIEEKLDVAREIYAAVTWDYPNNCTTLMGSSRGGVDIETVANENPGNIGTKQIDPLDGFSAYQARELATDIGLQGTEVVQYSAIVSGLWSIFKKHDAELVEINPLAILRDGSFAALDAKLSFDEKSVSRQSSLLNRIGQLPNGPREGQEFRRDHARSLGIPTYIEMEGDIAVVADGAGSGMLTLDLVTDLGGKIRVYCEIGGEITPELIENTMLAAMRVDNVRVLLINLIGGLNRMDKMAEGITNYLAKRPTRIPIVVRMSGTKQDEGRAILSAKGVGFYDNLYEAVRISASLPRDD